MYLGRVLFYSLDKYWAGSFNLKSHVLYFLDTFWYLKKIISSSKSYLFSPPEILPSCMLDLQD